MAPALSLSVSALSGGLLLVLAALLGRFLPRSLPARWWAASWVAGAAAFLLESFPPPAAVPGWTAVEPLVRDGLLQGSLAGYGLGVFAWTRRTAGQSLSLLFDALLVLGAAAAVVLPALGRPFPPAWALVPVLTAGLVLVFRAGASGAAPVRAQSRGFFWALVAGPGPFVLSWLILSWFPALGWTTGVPLLAVAGAALTLRTLRRADPRFPSHQAAPFVVEKTQDAVLFLRSDGAVEASNPALKPLLDWDEDGLNGRMLASLGADDESRRLLTALEQLTFPDWEGTLSLANRIGRPVPVHVVFRRLHNPAREAVGAVLLLYDLRLPRRLDLGSREDLLTALSNRRWVLELLEAEFQRVKRYGGPLSALWLEVTDLAAIEAQFGAEASDDVLRRLGSILRGGLRRTDFCGRVGHRDFLAVLPETPPDRAERVARRLEKMFALSEEGENTGAVLRIGWATLGEDSPTTEAFLGHLRSAVPAGSS